MVWVVAACACITTETIPGELPHSKAKLHPPVEGHTYIHFCDYKTVTASVQATVCPALVAVATGPLVGGVLPHLAS
jgi:hypothetical protein